MSSSKPEPSDIQPDYCYQFENLDDWQNVFTKQVLPRIVNNQSRRHHTLMLAYKYFSGVWEYQLFDRYLTAENENFGETIFAGLTYQNVYNIDTEYFKKMALRHIEDQVVKVYEVFKIVQQQQLEDLETINKQ